MNDPTVRDFVAKTLEQVIGGVKDAQERARELGGAVNPKALVEPRGQDVDELKWAYLGGAHSRIREIEFEIELTASDASSVGGGIAVAVVGLGGSKRGESGSAGRIRFKVPVAFPVQPSNE